MLQIMNTTLLLQIIHFSNNGLGCWCTDFDKWLRKLYKLMGSYCSNWSNIHLGIQWCFLIVCVQHMQNTVECYYISILVSGNKWHIAVKHSNSKIPLLFNMIQCNRMNQSKDDLWDLKLSQRHIAINSSRAVSCVRSLKKHNVSGRWEWRGFPKRCVF